MAELTEQVHALAAAGWEVDRIAAQVHIGISTIAKLMPSRGVGA